MSKLWQNIKLFFSWLFRDNGIIYFLVLLLQVLILVIFILLSGRLNPDPNDTNDFVVNTTNISQLNAVEPQVYSDKNLAAPDIETIYLGRDFVAGGVYRLYNANGITLDYDVYTGVYTMNGTTLLNGAFNILSRTYDNSFNPMIMSFHPISGTRTAGNVDLSFYSSYGTPNRINVIQLAVDNNNSSVQIGNPNVEEWGTTRYTNLFIVSGITFNNYQFKLQLEQGDAATPYTVPLQPLLFHEKLESWWSGYDVGFDEGWDVGYSFADIDVKEAYDKGVIKGQEIGDYQGYNRGFERGKTVGYNEGLAESDAYGFTALLSTIFVGLGGFLSINILPNISIGAIIAVPIVFGIIYFIIGRRKGD